MMYRLVASLTLGLPFAVAALAQPAAEQPSRLFEQLGLTSQEIAAIDSGRPVAKALSWGRASEIYVFGAVYVNGSPAAYLKRARDIGRLDGSPGYLAVGEIPATATDADLSALAFPADDIKALKSCHEGACDVQLPTASMRAFHDAANSSRPDASAEVNRLARRMLLDLIQEYRRGGNAALGVYRDTRRPARVADQFQILIDRVTARLPDVLPELRKYLLEYPDASLPGAYSYFYWENVDFGLKPTIRVNHGVIYHAGEEDSGISVVAIKQLYASHYFHAALDVSVCLADTARRQRRGFYLITVKASEQDGLTGIRGFMLRRVVVNKTRSILERTLASIKQAIEQSPS
jgi:hypothetical protein